MKEDIKSRWNQLTTAQISLLFLFLAAWPIFWTIDRYLGGLASSGGKWVLMVWLTLFVSDGWFIYFWRCPRCGEPFNSGFFGRTPYRRKCQKCKLTRGATQF
jgi:hypothetical protein